MSRPPSLFFLLFNTYVWAGGILAYGIYQYLKREKAHRMFLQNVIAGDRLVSVAPNGVAEPALWRLLSIGAVEILLMGSIIWLVLIRSKIHEGGEAVYIIAFVFFVFFAFMMPILMRDIKAYQRKKSL